MVVGHLPLAGAPVCGTGWVVVVVEVVEVVEVVGEGTAPAWLGAVVVVTVLEAEAEALTGAG